MARSMLSLGIDASLAFCNARASAELLSGSPPPSRAATWIARASLVKCAPRRWSTTAFLCLIDAHFEWPAMTTQFRDGLVQRRLRGGRVMPREPPQLAALVGPQAAAHEDDALDLLQRGSELDSLDEGRADLVVHGAPVSLTVLRPLCGALYPY